MTGHTIEYQTEPGVKTKNIVHTFFLKKQKPGLISPMLDPIFLIERDFIVLAPDRPLRARRTRPRPRADARSAAACAAAAAPARRE
jgi:hypothetical protein